LEKRIIKLHTNECHPFPLTFGRLQCKRLEIKQVSRLLIQHVMVFKLHDSE